MIIDVIGIPAPQGSKVFKGIRGGKGILTESSKKVKPWRESVVWYTIEAMRRTGINTPMGGALQCRLTFTLYKPKSAKADDWMPIKKPDLDKLIRSTMDALKTAGLICDDSQITDLEAHKRYVGVPDSAFLDTVGCRIFIASAKRCNLQMELL